MRLFYGWVIVGVGIVVTCIGMGTMMSLGVFLQPMSQDMGWSRAGISIAAVLNFLAMGFGSFFWGALSDRFGTRAVVLTGGVLLGLGLIAASQAATLLQFQLLFGVLVGLAAGSFYAPLTANDDALVHRAIAASPWHWSRPGMGLGSMLIAPLVALDHHQLRLAQRHAGARRSRLARDHSRRAAGAPAARAGARCADRRRAPAIGGQSSPWRRRCAHRSSPPSRSRTSRAARRIRARSSTWSATRSIAASRR